MNEQALQDAYDLFVSNGYSDSIDDFKKLISTNPQALNDSYDLFSSNGYSDSIDDYKVLLGIGTKPTSTPVKKKFALESSSEDGSLESKKSIKPISDMPTLDQQGLEQAMAKRQSAPTDMSGTPIVDTKAQKAAKPIIEKISKNKPQLIKPRVLKEQEEKESYLENLGTNVMAGVNDVNKMLTSIPETVYNLFSIPQNAVAYFSGLDISTSADKFKKNVGITNPVLDYYKEEGKKLEKEITDFNKERYESSSIYDNIQKGNYGDAFELLGSGIARSAPTSIAMMAGGATLSTSELAAASTAAFYDQNLEQIQEENPDASEIENNIKALGMAAAESVFSSIGEGQIGAVYKDIIKREGVEAGQKVFKDGLIQMYKGALEKYGVPVGLLGEGIEESATQITQNMISGKPAFEGAADAFILGGGSGVMFTAPISLKNAKDKIKNKIIEVDDKKKINTILADSNETFNKVFDVPKDSEINEKQLSIASLSKSRDLLVKDLKVSVKKGDMTEDQAKQSLYVFDKTQQITGQLRGVDIDDKSKVKVANLLKERENLSDKINGKDPSLSILEKQRIDEINKEIQDTILKSKENAVQEQSTTEIPVQSETGVSEEVEGRTPEAKPEVITEQVTEKEVVEEPTIKDSQIPLKRETFEAETNDGNAFTIQVTTNKDGSRNIQTKVDETVSGGETLSKDNTLSTEEYINGAYGDIKGEPIVEEGIDIMAPAMKEKLTDQQKAELGIEVTAPQTIIEKQPEMPIELQGEIQTGPTGFGGVREHTTGDVNLEDLTVLDNGIKTAEETIANDPNFKPSNKPIVVGVDVETGEKQLLDGYHRYIIKGRTGTVKAQFIPMKNGEIISFSETQPTEQITQENETRQQPTVQSESTGDRTRRTDSREIAPLEGSPTISGATGPDPQLVAVAEQYAADNGIDLKRQSEYVEVDEERAQRIAQAYEEMAHDPQNPKVKEAYAELIKQTIAQYQALVDAGYKFWFMDLNIPSNVEYAESPYNAMRDLRQNKEMGVFPTTDGFGTSELDVNDNPLLVETGFEWPVGGLDGEMKPVLANDLFRAVHDAFGHGLEGAGFRARGEENAWQAHIRLFTGPAKGAITSETRGQNSWLNYGPQGENNRTAKVEDTVFADQKTGLMPDWTWNEGLAGDMEAEAEVAEVLSQELNEKDLPGYDRAMSEVEGIVEKSKKRKVSESKIFDNVMNYITGSKIYENATDVQREALVRDVRKRFGLKEKAAPSVNKLFGKIKDITKVTLNEKTALKKQIRDVARGARDAVKSWKLASQQLGKEIKELKASGKITANQAANIISAFSKVNVFSGKSVDRFTNYMTKVFENADYAAKIKDAKTLRSNIKKLSKNKDKNANLRAVASQFVKIDPSLVEDINAYNEIASKIKEAITGSTVRGQKVKFAETTNIQEATDYISETLKEQEQKIREEMIAELQDLMGVDASEFSAEEMLALLEPEAKTNKYNEGIVRATIKKAFDVYSAMISQSIKSGKDVFTDEDVEYTKTQKDIIKRFMEMDTDKMSVKDSLAAVDALSNFFTNQSTAKMEAVIRKYTGQQNAAKIASQNIFAVPLKKLGSKIFGRFLGEQTTNLNILFEKMFVGFNRAGKVKDAMGLTDLVNGKSKAQRETSTIVDNYVSKFYNKLANNQKFNTLFNNIERGMTSFMSRNIIGTEAEMQSEFDRRKKLIEESIDVLSNGNEQERKKALVYQEVYDKILNDSTNIDEVQSKTDPTNLEAVDFWIKEWDSKFDELSDTSLNIYNKVLDKDLNYTPDRFTRMSYDGGSVDLANTDSAFINNTNGNLYKKETGVLMEASRPEELPKNADSNEAESYIDLSFDKNNSNSMYDALVDINTAGPIRQVEAFMNTADFRKIFGEDADLIKGKKSNIGRIQQYIQNIRNKNPYSNDEFAKAMRGLNKIASLGVGQALAGPLQPIKQVVPVALNTLVNTKGNLDTSAMSNKDFMDWLNQSGYAVANRGVESLAEIDSINKMIEEASKSKGAKLLNLLEEANKKWLKLFLVKPDVWIAISSWKSYYEQSLRDQGEDTKDIDYSSHEINKEAADYAQRMVDRQQNISDTDMSGTMFSNKNPYAQTMVKIFMPFASFRMNQGSRLGSDLRVLSNWSVSTAEDKKIAARSLSGYAVEMATFKLLSAGIAIGIASLTASLMGRGEDEEEKKKRRDNLKKGAITSTITDIVSPIPVLDKLVQNRSADVLSGVQDVLGVSEEDKVSLYESKKQNFVEGLGTLGIAFTRGEEIWDLLSLSVTGKYKDNYGKEKEISEENRKALSDLVGPVLLSNLTGFASPEVSSVSRNAVKIAKKKYLTDEEKSAKEEKAYEKEENLNQKERALKQVMDKYPSEDVREAAKDLLNDLNVESKEDEQQLKEERALERENKKALLVDPRTGTTYDNESELKRYNPVLWKKNFGPYSEWSKTHNAEKRAKKAMNKEIRKEEDKEYKYFKRSSKTKKNRDGTTRRSSKYSYTKTKGDGSTVKITRSTSSD